MPEKIWQKWRKELVLEIVEESKDVVEGSEALISVSNSLKKVEYR